MIVLGISEDHGATAALLRDGVVAGGGSEERFTRIKNDAGACGDGWERSVSGSVPSPATRGARPS